MSDEALKNCPLCGAAVRLVADEGRWHTNYHVSCRQCDNIDICELTAEKSTALWNRRPGEDAAYLAGMSVEVKGVRDQLKAMTADRDEAAAALKLCQEALESTVADENVKVGRLRDQLAASEHARGEAEAHALALATDLSEARAEIVRITQERENEAFVRRLIAEVIR